MDAETGKRQWRIEFYQKMLIGVSEVGNNLSISSMNHWNFTTITKKEAIREG
jgi:hypothetical protein